MAPSYDACHRIASKDGWPITLYRYRAAHPTDRSPILLCHGTNCRYRIFDLTAEHSLARALTKSGADVYALDLRGRGESFPAGTVNRLSSYLKGWGPRDFVHKDLLAAVEFVRSQSPRRDYDFVGHSMGALIMFELAASYPEQTPRRMVCIGGADIPAMIPLPSRQERKLAKRPHINAGILMAPFALTSIYTPLDRLAALGAAPFVPKHAYGLLLNPDNIQSSTLRRYLRESIAGLSAKKWWEFGTLLLELRNQIIPSSRYGHPTLFIAGAQDKIVPSHRIRQTATRATHPDNRFVELATHAGFSADYGHIDLLLGQNAPREVYPVIDGWFARTSLSRQPTHAITSMTG